MTAKIIFQGSLIVSWLMAVTTAFAIHSPNIEVISGENSRDLSLTHTLSHDRVQSGKVLFLTFSLHNHDLQSAHNIRIKLDIPQGFLPESYNMNSGEFLEEEGIWTIRHLEGGNNVSIQLNYFSKIPKNLTFSARITSAQPNEDPVTQNNETKGVIQFEDDECTVIYSNSGKESHESAFFLKIDCIENYPNNVLYIYDRWGNLVYEQAGYDNSWNGKRHPRLTRLGWDELPTDTYYYVLNFPEWDRPDISGWIYLDK